MEQLYRGDFVCVIKTGERRYVAVVLSDKSILTVERPIYESSETVAYFESAQVKIISHGNHSRYAHNYLLVFSSEKEKLFFYLEMGLAKDVCFAEFGKGKVVIERGEADALLPFKLFNKQYERCVKFTSNIFSNA